MDNLIKLNQRRWAAQLALTTGLALLFLAALLWGLQGVTPARADRSAEPSSRDFAELSRGAQAEGRSRRSPGTLYVDGVSGSDDSDCSNPAAPCATIGYALTQAGNGDEIRVAAGTYTETLDIAGNPITLRGGYTVSGTLWLPHGGETVVDADGADSPVINIGPGNNVTVEGFTVQGANHVSDNGGGFFIYGATAIISATTIQNNHTGESGGGIWYELDGVSVSLINSSLLNNSTAGTGGGGGIGGCCTNGTGVINLDNLEVRGNSAGHAGGGIMVADNTQAQIIGVVVEHNEADYGGGIAVIEGSSVFISNTHVISNTANNNGGGVGIWANGPDVVMVNTIISGNYGYDAGGLWGGDDGAFTGTNLLIVDNRSGPGPAGIALGGSGQLMNVTVAGNDSATGFDGAAIEGPAGGFSITNSIFWGNGTDGANLGGNNLNVSYSDVQGGFAGTGNISADPLFVDAPNGDYHLGVGSPCIDAGTPVGAPPADIEGTPRDAAPDMGAYEWTGFRIFLPLTLRNLRP